MNETILTTRSSMPTLEEYVDEIKCLWDTHWLTNNGVKHRELEEKLIEYLDVKKIKLFTNGHLALEAILEAMNLQGEVITTPYTFASTTHAIVRKGLTPIFCDINSEDFTIDVNKIEALITEKTCAIIPVHVYGNVCNIEKIEAIAKKHDLKVIYDAAHTFGVRYKGKGIGSYGDASMFSFHATKVFNTIEGGAITYASEKLSETLNQIKNFGIMGREEVRYVGGNAKMNEFQAAMGLCNLKYIDSEIEKRKKVVERYISNLSGVMGIRLQTAQNHVENNYGYMPVIFENLKKTRDEVYQQLLNHDILARKYFYPIVNEYDCYKGKYNVEDTPVAKYIADRVLTLPLYSDLSVEDVDKICKIIVG